MIIFPTSGLFSEGIKDSKLIETAYQLHGQLLEDRSRENVPLVGLIKEKPEYVFKVISSHQSEYNDWALELYLNCIVYSNKGFQQKIANTNYRLTGEINQIFFRSFFFCSKLKVNATPFLFSQVIRCNTEKTLSVEFSHPLPSSNLVSKRFFVV
jgi:hypothetical protein